MHPERLRIAILPNGPFTVNVTSSGKVTATDGFEVGLLDILIRGMQMPYTLHIPSDGSWGAPGEAGNWSGMMGMVEREEVDIAIGSIFVSEARMSVVSFSHPYTWQDITFATRKPGFHPKGTAFTWPFESLVWVCLGASVISVLLALQYRLSVPHSLQKLLFHILGTLLRQPALVRSHNLGDMLLLGLWMWVCFFLSYGYMAVLLSFLTIPLKEYPLHTVAELSKAVRSGEYSCGTATGSSVLETLLKSKEESIQTIGRYIVKNKWFVDFQREEEVAYFLNKGKSALIVTREIMKLEYRDQFYISRDALFSVQLAVAMNKNFSYKRKLDRVIKSITAFGIYQKSIDDYLYKKQVPYLVSEATSEQIKQLTLNDLYGAFIFLGCGNILAILMLILELFQAKFSIDS